MFAFWVLGSIFVGVAAHRMGRDGGGYGILSLFMSPLLVAVLLIAMGKTVKQQARELAEINKLLVNVPRQ